MAAAGVPEERPAVGDMLRTNFPDPGDAPRGKTRTSDCRHCLLLHSLQEGGVPASTVHAICERMWLNRVSHKQILYTEGNGATHLYALRSGRVKLVRVDAFGRAHVVALLGSGDLFGIEAIFADSYGTGAEALTHCELCLCSSDQIKSLMTGVPRVAADLARYLHRQLCLARDWQVLASAPSAQAKLAGYLLRGLPEAPDLEGVRVARDLKLRDLGGILGISAETVCRALTDLRTRGIVKTGASGICVLDIEALRQLASRRNAPRRASTGVDGRSVSDR
jgi:CRP/FNR family transcriptional regulator